MTDPAQPGQPPPPPPAAPPPAAPPPAAPGPAGGQNWSAQGQTPEWAQQAQNWRPAEVAAGPAPGVAYADLVMRVVAYIIDAIILGVVNGVIFSILFGMALLGGGFILLIIGALISLAISAAYFIYTWTTMRASPGQKVLNLMTVNEADGATLVQDQAIRRWAFLYGPFAIASVFSYGGMGFGGSTLGAAGIGGLAGLLVFGYAIYLLYTTANDPKRQGFHDKQARTVVVKTGA